MTEIQNEIIKELNKRVENNVILVNDSVDFMLNTIRRLNALCRNTSIFLIIATFLVGLCSNELVGNGSNRLGVFVYYLIFISVEAAVLITIHLLRVKTMKDILKITQKINEVYNNDRTR